ncbi:hypothetical protein [Agathobaculum sp. Marseille-P7918]|uniref:hypothetical protein n=1 Tax=Agathobaculum sp. Marseille-P7918 TaxID=2479843 RepID=UPI000F642E84|nr:hypothetical protein [Agathobaculum sp. Marseille-P7918]
MRNRLLLSWDKKQPPEQSFQWLPAAPTGGRFPIFNFDHHLKSAQILIRVVVFRRKILYDFISSCKESIIKRRSTP